MSVASLFTPCFVMFCVFLYRQFCHGAYKLDLSTLFTTFCLWTSLSFILTKVGSRSRSQSKIKPCMTVFRVRSISLNPWWDLLITLHKCQVWKDYVQCLGLTKVGSRSRSQFKIKYCMTIFRVRSLSFEALVGLTNNFAQISIMIKRCALSMFD